MKARLFTRAAFRLRNLGILLLSLGLASLISDPNALPTLFQFNPIPGVGTVAYPVAVALYVFSVMQTLASKKFHEEYNHKEKVRQIQDLNYECLKLANQAKKYTNSAYHQKMKKVIEDKNDIVDSFFKGERNYLKEKIVEQTLNLVVSYLKLLTNFCMRNRELSEVDIGEITNRINSNLRRLSFQKDPKAVDDIKKVIEIDEKMLDRLKEEKRDLERISAKLDYMEGTVGMFKHQVLSSVETEDMLEKLEEAVNEASALDNVLEDRRKNRLKY